MFAPSSSYSVIEAQVEKITPGAHEVQPSVPKALSNTIIIAIAKI